MTDVLLIVDMQVGLTEGAVKYDLDAVVSRINRVSEAVRRSGGTVILIRHNGGRGDAFEPETDGWAFLPDMQVAPDDRVIDKTLNDAYAGTALADVLFELSPDRVIVAGWATDFCVDAAVRSSVSRGYSVSVIADGHTLADRPHLSAPDVIGHHNWVWSELIAPNGIEILDAETILSSLGT